MERKELVLVINLKVIQWVLWLLTVALIFLGIIAAYIKFELGYPTAYFFVPKFNLDAEANIPTYFSAILLLISSGLLYVISQFKRCIQDGYASHWQFLSLIFLFLSVDEAAALHDILSASLREAFNLSSIFYYSWVVVGILFTVVLALFYIKFFNALLKKIKVRFIIAACFYIGGALGLEMAGGYYRLQIVDENTLYALLTTAEESFEMIGVLLFINTLFRLTNNMLSKLTLVLK